MNRSIIPAIFLMIGFAAAARATIINVPGDYPTIQQGINAAGYWSGDTVLVQPGIYNELISISAMKLTLASMFLMTGDKSYVDSTLIEGSMGFGIGCDSVIVIGFTIENGEGIGCLEAGPDILFNVIRNHEGVGIYFGNPSGTAVVKHNIICENSGWGGGIYCEFFANVIIENNIICHNHSTERGGGVSFIYYSGGTITNNVFYGNSTEGYGGGLYCSGSSPVVTNSIFWHDSAGMDGNEIHIVSGSPSIEYCDIEGGFGWWNLDVDPLFVDPENANFHLMSIECGFSQDSPCIDAGSGIDEMVACDWGLGSAWADISAYGGDVDAWTDIHGDELAIPKIFALLQNYPNPFNSSTVIRFSLPEQSDVRIDIYNILGQHVTTVFDGQEQAGYHAVTWRGDRFPSGVYFARLEAGERTENVKMVLLK